MTFPSLLPILLTSFVLIACEGKEIPDFPPLEQGSFTQLKARIEKIHSPLLVNFWATWCPPCMAELPGLMKEAQIFRQQGGRILLVSDDLMLPGISTQDARSKVLAAQKNLNLNAPIFLFDDENNEERDAYYHLPGAIPVTLCFDLTGKIVDRIEGGAPRERFREAVLRALGRKKGK